MRLHGRDRQLVEAGERGAVLIVVEDPALGRARRYRRDRSGQLVQEPECVLVAPGIEVPPLGKETVGSEEKQNHVLPLVGAAGRAIAFF